MDRISSICALLDKCDTFADVGCDHGYCTQYMLKNKLCNAAFITDISAKSLQKAEVLLADYIKNGVCKSVCCDGLQAFTKLPQQVLIAGMGGEEIIKILSGGIPEKFVLQPMKNAAALRSFLIAKGCKILYDNLFLDGKYYFIIKGVNVGGDCYSSMELEYGRDSLHNPLLKDYLYDEIYKHLVYYEMATSEEGKEQLVKKVVAMDEVLKCIQKIC